MAKIGSQAPRHIIYGGNYERNVIDVWHILTHDVIEQLPMDQIRAAYDEGLRGTITITAPIEALMSIQWCLDRLAQSLVVSNRFSSASGGRGPRELTADDLRRLRQLAEGALEYLNGIDQDGQA